MRPKAGETWFLCKLTYSSVPNKRGGGGVGGVGARLLIFDFLNSQDRLLRPPPPPLPRILIVTRSGMKLCKEPSENICLCIQHCGDNRFTSIKTCLLHCFVYTLVRNRPRKMDRGQHMSQRRGDFFILNENPTQCRGLADFVNPLPGGGGGGILIHSLTRAPPPANKVTF